MPAVGNSETMPLSVSTNGSRPWEPDAHEHRTAGSCPPCGYREGVTSNEPRVLPMGERAFLLEVSSLDEVIALHARLAASRIDGILDLVPAARTVLVRIDPRVITVAAARAWVQQRAMDAAAPLRAEASTVEIDVTYDGADLAETATLLGLTTDELIRRHAAAQWSVAFTGFAPGFGYLVSPDWSFDVPRLPAPRTRVPRGAVGLAGEFTGAYPRETPGGWRLIGSTTATLFDPDAAAPASSALLAPGTRVRFVPVRAAAHATSRASSRTGDLTDAGRMSSNDPVLVRSPVLADGLRPAPDVVEPPTIRILEPGLLATVQDLGRPGFSALGVAPSGALDRTAARTANRLLGNAPRAAMIEVTMGGFRAVALRDAWVTVTGASGPIRLAGRGLDPYVPHLWHAGDELHLDWFGHGARAYLALRGGLDAPVALGSRSSDVMAGLGAARLAAGDELSLTDDIDAPIPVSEIAPWGSPRDDEIELELAPGPRGAWFAASAHRALFDSAWIVTNDADRVGVRLDGPMLERAHSGELPSEGMVPGALQVPPSGRPTILLADGPVTGGYPVIAVATDAALDVLAQARPGTRIRFVHARSGP